MYMIACAAPPASDVQALVKIAVNAGWIVHVVGTPTAMLWLDGQVIENLCGNPVRSEVRLPGEGTSLPPADVIVVAPATFNTVNKF
jgi:phosphopantothenoylcysteine decarboxylase